MEKFTETRSFFKAVVVIIVAVALVAPLTFVAVESLNTDSSAARLITNAQMPTQEPDNNDNTQLIYDSDDYTGSSGSFSGRSSGSGSSDGSSDQDNGDDDNPENSADLNCDGMIDNCDLNILLAYYGIAYIPLSSSPDLNDDGVVDFNDLLAFLALYGSTDDKCPADFIWDQLVNERDLKILLAFYGRPFTCIINPDLNSDGVVDFDDLLILLTNYGTVA